MARRMPALELQRTPASRRSSHMRTPVEQPTQMSPLPHNFRVADEHERLLSLLAAPTPRGEPPSDGSDGASWARGVLSYPTLACAVRVASHWRRTGAAVLAQGAPVFSPELMLLSVEQRRPGDAVEQVYFDYFAGVSRARPGRQRVRLRVHTLSCAVGS